MMLYAWKIVTEGECNFQNNLTLIIVTSHYYENVVV